MFREYLVVVHRGMRTHDVFPVGSKGRDASIRQLLPLCQCGFSHLFCRSDAGMFILQLAQDLVQGIGKCFVRLHALALLQQCRLLGIPFLAPFGRNIIGMRVCHQIHKEDGVFLILVA